MPYRSRQPSPVPSPLPIHPQPLTNSWLQNNMRPGTKDRAYQRMFTLLGMPGKVDTPEMWESIGKYNLGTKRSLEQYQQFIGVNLTTLEVNKILKKGAHSR